MQVTRNVVQDLLPPYLAGEASSDTRLLVEAFLQQDPELARQVREHETMDPLKIQSLGGTAMQLPADHEARTLGRTKTLLHRRTWLSALAMAFSVVPFSFVFGDGRVTWMMMRDVPLMALTYWLVAAGFWIVLLVTNRRLRSTGL